MSMKRFLLSILLLGGALNAGTFIKQGALVEEPGTIAATGTTITLQTTSGTVQRVTGTAGHTIKLPNATLLFVGRRFDILNRATGVVSVQDYNGAAIKSLSGGEDTRLVLFSNAGSGGSWLAFAPSAGSIVETDPLSLHLSGNNALTAPLQIPEVASPAVPSSGFGKVYFKSDSKLYTKNDNGLEFEVFNLIGGAAQLAEIATPASPAPGSHKIYFKVGDDQLYARNSAGTEIVVGSGVSTLTLDDGSVIAPSLRFTSSSNTGLSYDGSLNFSVAGVGQLSISGTTIQANVPIGIPDGAALSPGLRFLNDPDMGIFRTGADILSIATAGVDRLDVGATGAVKIFDSLGVGPITFPTASSIFYARKDQDSGTRFIFRNSDAGSGANARITVTSDAGDLNITSTSIAAGGAATISSGSGYLGGLSLGALGSNPLKLMNDGNTNFEISGAGLVSIGPPSGTMQNVNRGQFKVLSSNAPSSVYNLLELANTGGTFFKTDGNGVTFIGLPAGPQIIISPTDIQFAQNAVAPSSPPALSNKLYFKTDGFPYYKNSTGVEIALSGSIGLSDGLVGSPSLFFLSDTNTGIFKFAPDVLAIATGGVLRAQFTNTSFIPNNRILNVDGDNTLPSYSFSSFNTGMYMRQSPTSGLGFAVGGADTLIVDEGGSVIAGNGVTTSSRLNSFLYVPTSIGTPTGVPSESYVGRFPLLFNSSDNKIYVYNGGWISSSPAETDPLSIHLNGSNSPTANIPWGGFKITGLADPTLAQDAATKAYVDSIGAVTGSGVSGRMSFWDGTSSISSDADFTWDATTNLFHLGSGTQYIELDNSDNISGNRSIKMVNGANSFAWEVGGGDLAYYVNGVNKYSFDATQMAFNGGSKILNSVGTEALPPYTFNGDPDTGIYHPGADAVGISANGSKVFEANSNGVVSIPFTGQTTTTALATILTIPIADLTSYNLKFRVTGRKQTTNDQWASYEIVCSYYREGGTAQELGETALVAHESDATYDCTCNPSTNDLVFQCNGNTTTAETVNWKGTYSYEKTN